MPKEIYLQRYSLIIKRLEKGAATFQEIQSYLESESDVTGKNYNISIRTFQRDRRDIEQHFNIEIGNEQKGDKRYYIKGRPENRDHAQRLLEAYEMVNVVKASQENIGLVFFEARTPKGLNHFNGLLHAVKNKKPVSFRHYKFWDDTITIRTVHPLALKEARGRWYLVAVDTKDEKLKTFGLDRMHDLDINKNSFRNNYNYNLQHLFQSYFGIINDADAPSEKVKLSFTREEGQYVEAYPLHHSQKVTDKRDRVEIELTIAVTHDLVMELMSYGESLIVLSPALLVEIMKEKFGNAIRNYKK